MDKRRVSRARVLLTGRIIFNNRCSVINCTVRDISDTGAQISFDRPVDIPRDVELDIPKRGAPSAARVIWSRGNNHGLVFVSGQSVSKDPHAVVMSSGLAPANPDLVEQTMSGDVALALQTILDDAQQRIAQAAGVPVTAVRLKAEIDESAAGRRAIAS